MGGGFVTSTTSRILARVNTEPLSSIRVGSATFKDQEMSHSVRNSIRRGEDKAEAPRRRGLTRDSRATVEQVLDRRTLLLLQKLMKWDVFSSLFGCISTGKEVS